MTYSVWNMVKASIEILVLWIVYYRILVFFAGTRAFQVLRGITYLVIAFLACKVLGFDTLNWLLEKFFAISIVAILIIFQQELRQGLARLGQQHVFNLSLQESELLAVLEEVATACFKMAKQKMGALIAIERETKLSTYIESGLVIDSKISSELLLSIFSPQSPIHDGGAIVRNDRIIAAACLFPLTDSHHANKSMGTRHRAALGITEQTDALVVVISEETGNVSLARDGKLISTSNPEELIGYLKNILISYKRKR